MSFKSWLDAGGLGTASKKRRALRTYGSQIKSSYSPTTQILQILQDVLSALDSVRENTIAHSGTVFDDDYFREDLLTQARHVAAAYELLKAHEFDATERNVLLEEIRSVASAVQNLAEEIGL